MEKDISTHPALRKLGFRANKVCIIIDQQKLKQIGNHIITRLIDDKLYINERIKFRYLVLSNMNGTRKANATSTEKHPFHPISIYSKEFKSIIAMVEILLISKLEHFSFICCSNTKTISFEFACCKINRSADYRRISTVKFIDLLNMFSTYTICCFQPLCMLGVDVYVLLLYLIHSAALSNHFQFRLKPIQIFHCCFTKFICCFFVCLQRGPVCMANKSQLQYCTG